MTNLSKNSPKLFARQVFFNNKRYNVGDPVPLDIDTTLLERYEKSGYTKNNPQYNAEEALNEILKPYKDKINRLEEENKKLKQDLEVNNSDTETIGKSDKRTTNSGRKSSRSAKSSTNG